MANKCVSRMPTCVLVCLLFMTPLALMSGPAGAATTITTLAGGAASVDLTFQAAGTDTSAHLSIPMGCTVTGASMTIEGKPLKSGVSTIELTYNDTDKNKVWSGTLGENISKNTKTPAQLEGSATDGTALAQDDQVYVFAQNKAAMYTYQQFKFQVDVTEISEITIEWNGYAYFSSGMVVSYDIGAQLFIWNNDTQLWEELDHYDGGHGIALKDYWVKKTLSGSLDKYLYNVNEIRVVGSNWYSNPAGQVMASSDMHSDFIKAKVTGRVVAYPMDVELDVGNDGTVDWTFAGQLLGVQGFTGDTFKAPLQSLITAAGPGHGNLDIVLAVSTAGPGVVGLSNISIIIDEYINKAPVAQSIPSTYHFAEDTDAPDLIDITDYFTDDMDPPEALTYAIANESDPQYLHATVSAAGKMSFTTPTENWFGNATFKVSAKDTNGLTTISEPFTVRVDAVADPPVLSPVGALEFTEGKAATLTLSATDPDKLFGGSDSFTYGSMFEGAKVLFTVNPKTGSAAFIPKDADVGTYTVTFSVQDSTSLDDTEVVTFEVKDVNNPPTLTAIGKQVLTEDSAYSYQLQATDIDASDAEALQFTVTFEGTPLFEMGTDGAISFTPVQAQVGLHKAVFKVTDSGLLTDEEEVTFDIRNVNDGPVLAQLADQTVNRNTPFSIQAKATDEDIGYAPNEVLTFEDASDMFEIDPTTGWMNFTTTKAQVGKHTIKVTVTDMAGAVDEMTFELEVVLNNTAPVAAIKVDGNKTKAKEGKTFVLRAEASDADNDPLTYKWSEDGKELGTEKELSLKGLKVGKHTITLEVSDGITKTTLTQGLTIEKKTTGMPGFDAIIMMAAMVVAAVLVISRARRR